MNEELQRYIDEQQIREARRLWAYGRDMGEWDLLRSVFHPDATVHVSWFKGPASEFITRSAELGKLRKPEEQGRHSLGNMRTAIRGARAVQETDIEIRVREYLDGHLFDYTGYGRFYDLFEKREGRWKISSMTCIYEKDRLDPVVPASVPASFYDGLALEGAESGFAFMRFRLARRGREAMPVVFWGSADERSLRAQGERWLAQG